jgi:glycosyltransferase involved in cell wall biosynthesis
MSSPTRVLYFVSRFPHVSETFVLRELNEVAALDGFEVDLASLFPPSNPFVHPAAKPWLARVQRPTVKASIAAWLWWSVRRPAQMLKILAEVVAGSVSRPRVLIRNLATLAVAAAHARRIAADPPDHLHAHFASYPTLAAWFCHRLLDVPYSFTAHAHDIFLHQCLLRRKVEEARFVVGISERNRRFLQPYTKDGAPPIEVVHCGIDPGAYRFRPRTMPADGPLRFLCVAHFADYKGHRVLLDAIAAGGERLERVQLDLIGSGPLQQDLEEQARRLGLNERVHLHGNVAEPEVAETMDRADAFVLASIVTEKNRQDGIPVALMEAIACGLPVVASRLSGIPELVREGESGLLAAPGDAADLSAQLCRLVEGDAGLDPEAGRRRVDQEFNIHKEAARMAELFSREPG